ncbi:hypothetical protein WA538_002041 [Blastocystis sp. DL]
MDLDTSLIHDYEEKVVNHPEGFVNGNEEFKNTLKSLLKMLFDVGKALEVESFGDLPELYTDGFDAEGVWEQVRLRMEPLLDHYKRELSDLEKIDVSEEVTKEGGDEEKSEGEEEMSEEGIQEEEDVMQEGDDMQEEDDDTMHSAHSSSEEETMIASEDSEKEEKSTEEKPMDDKQLWEEMQKFGDYEEEEMAKEEAGEASDAEFDIMQPIASQESEKESDMSNNEDEDEDEDEEDNDNDNDKEDEDEDNDEDRRKLKRQISELEDSLLQPRSWELMGEATADRRGENELLEVDLDVDRVGATAPVSTVESTLSLEDMIKKRILDQAFDDPVRKAAPREKEKKPLEEVSTEKSAKGLGEIYEDEYMLQVHNYDKKKEELDGKKKELQLLFTKLCVALDRLSNAHFTPAAAVKTLAVVSTAPALAMEEALPISVSKETQQTPEETYASETKVLKGDSEKTQEERQRERRAKKERKHAKKVQEENDLRERAAYDEGARRILENRKVKESLEAKNVVKGKESSKSDDFKSTAFFKKLQEETTAAVDEIKGKVIEKKKKVGGASASYKL